MKKKLKDMFMLPLTEDEQNKIKDSKKSTELWAAEGLKSSEPDEIIKRKWDLKKLYICIPKKSGWGYRLNYAPG